jgi:hypothetical protein
MRWSSEAESIAASGIGVLGFVLGKTVGLVSTGGDMFVAFLLGASGAAGGYVVKEVFTYIQRKFKR